MSEKLNELKKATMASYLSKAGARVRSGTKIGLDFEKDAYKDMATANKHHPNMVTPGFEKDPEKLASAEKSMKTNFDLAKSFKRDAANRIKGIARAGRLLAKEETIEESKNTHVIVSDSEQGFWSNKQGWVYDKKSASRFDPKDGYHLPMSAKNDAKFVHHKDAPTKFDEETIAEAGKNPYGPGYKLVDKDGAELKVGHKFMHTSHHEGSEPEHHTITGWQSGEQRGNSSSSGRVAVKVGKGKKAYDTEYFPHVFGMKVVKEEAEPVNEVSRSTIAKLAQARFNQAQAALKDKDFGGYVNKMKKAIKAGDATTPKTGWSAEDDKKNEEVVPEVSAQEKYRQIKEAKLRARKDK